MEHNNNKTEEDPTNLSEPICNGAPTSSVSQVSPNVSEFMCGVVCHDLFFLLILDM